MKRFLRILCMTMVLVTLLSTVAFAAEIPEPRASAFFSGSSVYLWKTSSTSFQVWFDVVATGTMDKLGASYIEVQESSNGVNWTNVGTYYMSGNSSMTKSNTAVYANYVTFNKYNSSKQYRAYITLYAKDGNDVGELGRYAYFAN